MMEETPDRANLDEIAFYLLLKGENPYRGRAYEHAAMALLTCPEDVATLMDRETLTEVKGIGPAPLQSSPRSPTRGQPHYSTRGTASSKAFAYN
jgi:hypothetical protein